MLAVSSLYLRAHGSGSVLVCQGQTLVTSVSTSPTTFLVAGSLVPTPVAHYLSRTRIP